MIPLRDANPTRRTPIVTLSLIVACFVVFAYELGRLGSGGMEALDAFAQEWGIVPAELTNGWTSGTNLANEAVTLVTSQFLHGGWLHILGNMLYLWIFGNNVEDAMGRVRFLGFYVIAGLAATATQTAVTMLAASADAERIPSVGASGAIAGVLGAYFVLLPRARVLVWSLFFLFEVPALAFLGLWFLFQLWSGSFSILQPEQGGGVAFFAHIGGFAFGVTTVKLFARRDRLRL